jgi:hypothetical protein
MSLALLYPEPEKLRRKGKGSLSESERQSITAARLSQARSVLAFSRELAGMPSAPRPEKEFALRGKFFFPRPGPACVALGTLRISSAIRR